MFQDVFSKELTYPYVKMSYPLEKGQNDKIFWKGAICNGLKCDRK